MLGPQEMHQLNSARIGLLKVILPSSLRELQNMANEPLRQPSFVFCYETPEATSDISVIGSGWSVRLYMSAGTRQWRLFLVVSWFAA